MFSELSLELDAPQKFRQPRAGQDCGARHVLAAPHPCQRPPTPQLLHCSIHYGSHLKTAWRRCNRTSAKGQATAGQARRILRQHTFFVSPSRTTATVIDGCRVPVLLLSHPSDATVTKTDERRKTKSHLIRDRSRPHTCVLFAKRSIFLPHTDDIGHQNLGQDDRSSQHLVGLTCGSSLSERLLGLFATISPCPRPREPEDVTSKSPSKFYAVTAFFL